MTKSLNLLSPAIQSIVERTIVALPQELWAGLPQEQRDQIVEDLEFAFRNKMVTTVWSIDDFTPFLDHRKELSFERKRLIARRAMRTAENDFDPDTGLDWIGIESHVNDAMYQIELDEQVDAQQNKAK